MIDGSRVLVEAMARAGVDAYIGYPVTPANWLHAYARERMPAAFAAPDEITALQWASGLSASGKLPLTATSFPGFALMIETLNMAHMMELPMVIILAQRLGPSTGSATVGAQGDLLLLRGCISGGNSIPVFCPPDLASSWTLAAHAVDTALALRTPVVILTSKEMIMLGRSFDLDGFEKIEPVPRPAPEGEFGAYQPDANEVPPFLPVGDSRRQVRLNASTHDADGLIRKATPEALSNTRRLQRKLTRAAERFNRFTIDDDADASTLIVTYGITSGAAREAVATLRKRGRRATLLILESLIPIPNRVGEILDLYEHVIIVEENDCGLLAEMLYGKLGLPRVRRVNKIGSLISPGEIVDEVERCQSVS
jgi:2-oxoglutarate ferredoxin oxidoreductase subunit alpha